MNSLKLKYIIFIFFKSNNEEQQKQHVINITLNNNIINESNKKKLKETNKSKIEETEKPSKWKKFLKIFFAFLLIFFIFLCIDFLNHNWNLKKKEELEKRNKELEKCNKELKKVCDDILEKLKEKKKNSKKELKYIGFDDTEKIPLFNKIQEINSEFLKIKTPLFFDDDKKFYEEISNKIYNLKQYLKNLKDSSNDITPSYLYEPNYSAGLYFQKIFFND